MSQSPVQTPTSSPTNMPPLERLAAAIAGNVLILSSFLVFLFAGFFLYLAFTGKPLLFQQPETADLLGRAENRNYYYLLGATTKTLQSLGRK